ncbi:MAG: hypothetical protein QM751_06045 [Paludibacteraceae bacterium]
MATVEQKNTTLKALRETLNAQKVLNQTGIFLENPEVEFNYLWGKPGVIGNRLQIFLEATF